MCELIARGQALSLDDVAEARSTIARARRWGARHVRDNEMILTFAATGEAPRSETTLGSAIFNRLWSALDAACLHLPMERGPEGMPVGVQIVAAGGDEAGLLSAGRWLQERCADFPGQSNQ
jgi:Asp-tRNA(Asn)/Glu-tRNA(Gln) amidotransferase A subunit family amidase